MRDEPRGVSCGVRALEFGCAYLCRLRDAGGVEGHFGLTTGAVFYHLGDWTIHDDSCVVTTLLS